MLKKYYAYEYVESVFSIDYNKLYQKGYKGIIFDLDNTLVGHGIPSSPEIDELFTILHEIGFKTFILSDNGKNRIEEFLENIECPYIDNANKPNPANYLKALECMKLSKDEVVYVGDQIFTDIVGGNRCKMFTILVEPIAEKDIWITMIKSPIVNAIKKKYHDNLEKGSN